MFCFLFLFFFYFALFHYYSSPFPSYGSRDVEHSLGYTGFKDQSRTMNRPLHSKWALTVVSAHRADWLLREKLLWFGGSRWQEYLLPSPKLLWGITSWPGKPFLQQMAFVAHLSPMCTKIAVRMPVPSQSSLGSYQCARLSVSLPH